MSDNLMRELIAEVKSLHSTLSVLQQDVNAIRNGEYDKPQGADSGMTSKKHVVLNTDFTGTGITGTEAGGTTLKTSREW